MDLIREYKKNIVENKNFVFVSIFLSILIRFILFYSLSDKVEMNYSDSESSLLVTFLPNFVFDKILLFLLGTVFCLGITLYAAFLNTKYALIRNRTYLVYVFMSLVFSCHPVFLFMNTQYIALFLFLVCIDILYGSYQEINTSQKTYAVGFILALGSLFSCFLLLYLVLFWIGFVLMRSLNFKSFLTSILGALTVYWLVFSYYLWQYTLSDFVNFFTQLQINIGYYFRLESIHELVSLVLVVFFMFLAVLSSQLHSFEDKIRIRAKISFLEIIAVFSILFSTFVNLDPIINIYIFGFCYVMMLSHFFTLVEQKWEVYLFYAFVFSTVLTGLFFLWD
jgi:hypothetical protein